MPSRRSCASLSDETRTHADWLLQGIIKPVMNDFPNFTVKRADEDPRPGLIDAHLINDLLVADLVIADLSFLNPNAFYEIGIRHMAQKPIIHMQLAEETIPFDLSLYRAVKFSRLQFHELETAKAELRKVVAAVLADGYQVENPVTRARGKVQLDEHATPEIKVLANEVEALREQIRSVETIAIGTQVWVKNALTQLSLPDETARIVHALRGQASTHILTTSSHISGTGPTGPSGLTYPSENPEKKP
jgi:hypothetical protein